MKKQKLNFRFYNPNTAEATADYILQMFIAANREKVEQAIHEASEPPILYTESEAPGIHSA